MSDDDTDFWPKLLSRILATVLMLLLLSGIMWIQHMIYFDPSLERREVTAQKDTDYVLTTSCSDDGETNRIPFYVSGISTIKYGKRVTYRLNEIEVRRDVTYTLHPGLFTTVCGNANQKIGFLWFADSESVILGIEPGVRFEEHFPQGSPAIMTIPIYRLLDSVPTNWHRALGSQFVIGALLIALLLVAIWVWARPWKWGKKLLHTGYLAMLLLVVILPSVLASLL